MGFLTKLHNNKTPCLLHVYSSVCGSNLSKVVQLVIRGPVFVCVEALIIQPEKQGDQRKNLATDTRSETFISLFIPLVPQICGLAASGTGRGTFVYRVGGCVCVLWVSP